MGKIFACPFWRYEKNGFSYCENSSRLRFRRLAQLNRYQKTYCMDAKNWEKCTIAQEMKRGAEHEQED